MPDRAAPPTEAGATLLPLRIVHAAIASTVLVYAAMLSLLTRRPPDSTVARETPPAGLTWMLGAIAAIVLVAAVLVRRRAQVRARRLFDEAPPPAPAGRGRAGNPAAPYFTTCLLSWALAEVVAVLGLVLGFLHWQLTPFLPFGAVSLAALLYLAPRRRELEAILGGTPRG